MDSVFLFRLCLSFFVGAVWTTLVTVIADRYGSKIGGVLGGLPNTLLLALFFIAWTQSGATASEATTLVPVVAGIDCVYVLVYILFVKKNFWLALASAYGVWVGLSLLVLYSHMNYIGSLAAYAVLFGGSYYILEHVIHTPSLVVGKRIRYTPTTIALRGFLGGTAVAVATYITKIGGPLLGGIMSMFPAMFAATIIITYFANGAAFSSSTMKNSIRSGVSLIVYIMLARWSYNSYGLVVATLIPAIGSYLFGYINYRFFMKEK